MMIGQGMIGQGITFHTTEPAAKYPYELEVAEVTDDGGVLAWAGHLDADGNPQPPMVLDPGQYVFRTRFNDFENRRDPSKGWTPWSGFNAAGVPFIHRDQAISESRVAAESHDSYSHRENEVMAMSCCGSPDPAILEKNSRLFCRNCKRYLDVPPKEQDDRGGDQARDAGPRDEPGNG